MNPNSESPESFAADAAQVLDYAFLRRQGMDWLQRLAAGSQWTDFNAHDPGITILEQLCYALSDLAYRIDYDLPDLLSRTGEDAYGSLYGADRILSTQPVTLLDLRKLILDVDGVKNAWIETVAQPQPPLFYQEHAPFEAGEKLIRLEEGEGAQPLQLKGLCRVLLEKSETLDRDSSDIKRDVARRLHAQRGLALDFESIQVLNTQDIRIQANVEIEPWAHPEDLYLAILQRIDAYISPSVPFQSLGQCLAQGKSMDEIFDGPLLRHGFIDMDALSRMQRKTALYTAELVREIMDVEGVRMVEFVAFKTDDAGLKNWSLDLAPDLTPKLDIRNSTLQLQKTQLPIALDTGRLLPQLLGIKQTAAPTAHPAVATQDLKPPAGRDRNIGRYHSLMHQFPSVYGVGPAGLATEAGKERQAQAKQLQAYLLFFDQLLANGFAQLAHLRDLFGYDDNYPQTYFAGVVDTSTLGGEALWKQRDPDTRQTRLQQIAENPNAGATATPAIDWRRKNRFLDHLLARFAEQIPNYGCLQHAAGMCPLPIAQQMAQDKQALLRRYPAVSSGRGSGFNALDAWSEANFSGLELRLRLKLGVADGADEPLYLVEHILLRPIEGDQRQTSPLLAQAQLPDPYSLQLSWVFSAASTRAQSPGFRRFVEQTARDESPAHLAIYQHWLDAAAMAAFEHAYQAWVDRQYDYRHAPASDGKAALRLRDARDRLIDLLGIGYTYPLEDLAVPELTTVAYNVSAQIKIENSQAGVVYALCDKDRKALVPPVEAEGNGGDLFLTTPPIKENRVFTIRAGKLHGKTPPTFLLQTAAVKVGLDKALTAQIVGAELLIASASPAPADARIVDYGARVSVEVVHPQEGVDYQLVKVDAGRETTLSDKLRGNPTDTITLQSSPVAEDFDIRIRATKTFDPSEHRAKESDLLNAALPLKVRANPSLAVSVAVPVLDYRGGASVKIAATQVSAQYRILLRDIADAEFVRGKTDAGAIKVPVPGQADVLVRQPSPDGFAAVGAAAQGSGGDLLLACSDLEADSFIVIQAQKNHSVDNHPPVPSTVRLAQAAVTLIRPDPAPPLRLKAAVASGALAKPIQAFGGQAGVFYHFADKKSGKALGGPVYFHQHDRLDHTQNKGVGQLEVGVDLVVAPPLQPARLQDPPDLASLPPEPPELDIDSLKTDATLSIRAVKAQTGLDAAFERTVADLTTPD